jgi:4-diphosphocytidyl-2-C-methyl-D-erythritol kinase
MEKSVRLPAFAKINLCLRVLGRRSDGYHELRTIFQAISLHDTLEISLVSSPGITLETNDSMLPTGPENLVYRALDSMRAEMSIRGGLHARLEKRIPVARGLGGGSTDAVAALIGILRLTKKKLPLERLMAIAASLGADVPFFLFGGRAVAASRGDEIYPLPDAP